MCSRLYYSLSALHVLILLSTLSLFFVSFSSLPCPCLLCAVHVCLPSVVYTLLTRLSPLQAARRYCPHHVGHYLGMDVHDTPDLSRSQPLQAGMAVTVEPGERLLTLLTLLILPL